MRYGFPDLIFTFQEYFHKEIKMDEWSREYREGQEEILEKVSEVFADAVYPGDDNIVTVPDHWEYGEMGDDFRGKHWREVSTSLAVKWRMSTFIFTPEAFCFYFPAFILAAWGDIDGSDISAFLIQDLIPPASDDPAQLQFLNRVSVFTPRQKDVVRIVVEDFITRNSEFGWDEVTKERIRQFWQIEF
jgi:hypothetical protein